MGRIEQVGAAVVEHGSPAGGWRRHAEAKKTHSRFGKNGARHTDCRLHDDRLNDVGQNVANHHAPVACAQSPRCFHILAFTGGKHLSPDQARIADPPAQRERQHQIENSRPAKRDESNGQQDSRKGEKGIHDYDVDEAINPATVIARNRAHHESQEKRARYHRAPHQHGNLCPVDQAGDDIPAQFIGAAPVHKRRARQAVRQVNRGRILWREPGRENREHHKNRHQHDARRCQWITPGGAAKRDGGGRHGTLSVAFIAVSVDSRRNTRGQSENSRPHKSGRWPGSNPRPGNNRGWKLPG